MFLINLVIKYLPLNVYSIKIAREESLTTMKRQKSPPTVHKRETVVSDTDVRLKISRYKYVPINSRDYIRSNKSCEQGDIGLKIVGAFASPIEVSFQKHSYEQLMRTLDNIMYASDIDQVEGCEPLSFAEIHTVKTQKLTDIRKKHTPMKALIKIPLNITLLQDLGDGRITKVAKVKLPKIMINFSKELYYYSSVNLKIFRFYRVSFFEMSAVT